MELKKIFDWVLSLDEQCPQERAPDDLKNFRLAINGLALSESSDSDYQKIIEQLGVLSPYEYEDPNNIVRALAPLAWEKKKEALGRCGVTLQCPRNPWANKLTR